MTMHVSDAGPTKQRRGSLHLGIPAAVTRGRGITILVSRHGLAISVIIGTSEANPNACGVGPIVR